MVEETRVSEMITAALGESGAIQNAIQTAVASAIADNGLIKAHIDQALREHLSGPVTAAVQAAVSDSSYSTKADSSFPFRKVLQSMTSSQFSAAWRGMMVDPDHIQAMSDGMGDASMVSILALQRIL